MDPLPEGWTEEPVPAPPAPVTQEPLPAGWTEEPVAPTKPDAGSGDELAPLLTKEQFAAQQTADRTLSDPYAGQRERALQEKADQEDLVRSGFKAAKEPGVDPKLADLQMAKHFDIPLGIVQANRPGWLDAYAKSAGDPEKWIEENPLSAKLLLDHPELADHVVSNKTLNAVLQGWNKVVDFTVDARQAGREAGVLPKEGTRVFGGVGGLPVFGALESLVTGDSVATDAAQQAGRAARDNPKPAIEVNDAEAQRIRDEGLISIVAQRAKESRQQLEVSRLYSQLLIARGTGRPTTDLETQIYTAEQDLPKALGETGATQALAEAWATSQSTLKVLQNVVERGVTGAGAGSAIGGAAGALLTKSPVGAAEGAAVGAQLGRQFGASYGAAEGSFVLESGDSYSQFLKLKTDAGESLTEPEARGGALIAASIKTGVELVELHSILKALGPAGAALEGGGASEVRTLLASNPGFRTLAVQAAKAWAGEGGEEYAQEAVDEATGYLAASKHDHALQQGPVFDPEKLKENFVAGLMGGALFGVGGLVVSSGQHSIAQSREARAALQVPDLAKIAADPSAPTLAVELAQVIAKKGAETGDEQTHVYVSAEGFQRLFQKDSEQKAAELLGDNGPEKLAAAIATGGKVAVPLQQYLGKWGKDDVAAKLADETSATNGPSPREIKEQSAANEAWAKEIAAGQPGVSETSDSLHALEQTMVELGQASKSEAEAAVKPIRSVFETFAKKFGQKADDLFRNVRFILDDGTKQLQLEHRKANVSEVLSAELHDGLTPAQGADRVYVDNVTDLHSFAGWEHQQREKPAPEVASITIPDIKPVNDNVLGGHDTANALLRHLSPAIAAVDATAGRKGTNFLFKGGAAELQKALEGVRKLLPAGMEAVGAVGKNTQSAIDAMDKLVDSRRATVDQQGNAVKPTLAARGETKADLKQLPAIEAAFNKETGHRVKPTPAMVAHVASLTKRQFFRFAYQDEKVPGVLSHIAWELTPRKAHVASIDIKGLKDINDLGKEVGDKVLKLFAEVVARFDGSDFDFAHLSGDEYAAQHDDPVKLQAWLDHVRAELQKVGVPVDDATTGEVLKIEPKFRSGVGEKTYGNADRVLNASKLEEKRLEAEQLRNAGKAEGDQSRGSGAAGKGGPLVQTGAGEAGPFHRRGAPGQAFVDRKGAGQVGEKNAGPIRLSQPGDEADVERGFTIIAREGIDKVYRIGLSKNANQSTFLHESAHVFLDLFADLAGRADAPASVVADWETTLAWLGVKNAEEIKVEHHEKWARGFERYLGEGVYPSEKLAGAFQRFRLWMGSVYKKLSTLGDINPEIRGVFDRLLATDAEIEATKNRMGLKALPREALGMTGEEYAAHLDELAKATSHAAERADFQVTKDRLRATEEWWKDALRQEKAKAADAYEQLPARRAQLILSGKPAGEWLGMNGPLNRPAVEGMVGQKAAAKFRLSPEGIHPDELSELLGFGTGKGMLEAILQLPEKDAWVHAKADDAMREAYPGILDERTQLRELVAQGLHGPATKEWLLKEWAALQSKGTKESPRLPPAAVIKRAAEVMAAGRAAGNLHVADALADERRAADNSAKAAARDDFAQAAVFKQQQVLNMYLHEALRKAQKEVDAFLTMADDLSRLKARQRLGKASPVYRDGVDLLLATFDLKAPEAGLNVSLDSALADVEKLMNEDQTPVGFDRARIVDRASRRGLNGWAALPMEDLRQVFSALKNIEAAARNRSTVMLSEKRADIEQVVEGLKGEAELLEKRPDEPTPEAESFGQGIGRRWTAYDGALLKIETMARWLGGGKNTVEFLKSFWFRAIIEPMQNGKTKELDLSREHLQPIIEAYDAIPRKTASRQMEKIDGRKLFPTHVAERLPSRRFEILQMLLNTGNQSNFDRLTKGRNITEDQVRAAAIEVGVTKEEYAWIQSIWDAAEKLKPLAFDIEEKTSGVRPEEIVAKPFETPFGTVRGGYFPAVYDAITRVGQKQESDLSDFQRPGAVRPTTLHNFLKARADDFSDLISLSPSSINRHFTLVIHDIAFREPVQSVGALLIRDDVQATLRERLGSGRSDQFLQWVADVAQMRGIEGLDKSGGLMKLAAALRGNLVAAVLGYKIPNALEDFTSNLLSAIPASDLKPQHLAGAIAEFGTSPIDTRAMVLQKSAELRSRQHQVARELAQQIRKLTASGPGVIFNKGPIAWYKNHAFAFAEGVEVATATPIWLGAYRQALKAAQSETEAVTFADATVRQVLVSHNTVDLSGLMRDKGPIGYMTMFFGAFNHFYNQFRDLGHRFNQADDWKTKASMAGRTLGLATGLFVVGSIARGQGPNPDEEIPEWLARKMLLEGFLQMFPGANVLGQAGSTLMQGKKVQPRNNSLFGIIESIGLSLMKIGDSEADAEKRVKELLKALGPLTGAPTDAPIQGFGPLVDWALDQNEWRNPFDAASDVVYGHREGQGANVLQAAGDLLAGGPRN